jgi:hypothetical protein
MSSREQTAARTIRRSWRFSMPDPHPGILFVLQENVSASWIWTGRKQFQEERENFAGLLAAVLKGSEKAPSCCCVWRNMKMSADLKCSNVT